MKSFVPSFITMINLFCGCLASVTALSGAVDATAILLFIALVLDFLDGFLARKLKAESELGKQLDSLADLISFGLVPGLIMFNMFLNLKPIPLDFNPLNWNEGFLPFSAFLITVSSALRLANFNIDTKQTNNFIGLPVPANTLFIISLPLIKLHYGTVLINDLLSEELVLFIITLISSFLLNMPIPLIALKFKSNKLKDNKYQILLLISSIVLLVLLKFIALPLIIILYIVFSIVKYSSKNSLTM